MYVVTLPPHRTHHNCSAELSVSCGGDTGVRSVTPGTAQKFVSSRESPASDFCYEPPARHYLPPAASSQAGPTVLADVQKEQEAVEELACVFLEMVSCCFASLLFSPREEALLAKVSSASRVLRTKAGKTIQGLPTNSGSTKITPCPSPVPRILFARDLTPKRC